MLQYIRDKITAVYLTDATGLPTQVDMLDADGVSLLTGSAPVFQVPNTFATNQWSVATGTNPAEINITISVLPANNGSPITAIQYRVGTGPWVTLPEASTGTYPVTMPATSTAYSISLRAINIVGPSAQSAAKTATSGAPAATAPAAFGPALWTLATGTEPASLTLNILSLPNNGGSAITGIEYRIGSGEWVAFADAETGPRSILMEQGSTAYSVTIRAVNAVNPGPASAAKTATSSAPAQQAPSVQTAPTISGNTTVGSILTRTAGTASGIPTPTRATVWLRNGTVITGQTGNTLDTTGFAVDDAITTRDIWTNSQGTATGTSDPIVLTVQPTLQATITPDPLVAGEDFEIVIDPAPDSVSPLTLVRDADDARRYTGTAPDSGTLAIGATKAGYQPWSQTYTYDPAPVVLPGSITVESDGTISITVPDDAEPFDVQIGADVVTLDPVSYTPSGAPVVLGQPDIAGTGGDGEELTVQSRALFAGHADAGEIAIVGGWYRNETAVGDTDGSYTQDDAVDGDRTLTWRETATNAAGSVTAVSNGILCPASEIPALPAGLSVVGLFEGEPSGGLTATHTAPISLGGADPQKTIYVLVRALSSVSSGKIIVGGTEYPLTLHHVANLSSGNNRMALMSADVPTGGQATLSVTTSGTWSGALSAYVLATKAMTLVTSSMAFVTMTAGTAITQNVADTQVGDQFLAAVMAAPYDQAGIFGSAVAVTEQLDQPLTAAGPQLWVGTGTETAAINPRPVRVTPSQPGNAIRLIAHFRSAA